MHQSGSVGYLATSQSNSPDVCDFAEREMKPAKSTPDRSNHNA